MQVEQVDAVCLESHQRGVDSLSNAARGESWGVGVAADLGGDEHVVAGAALAHPRTNRVLTHAGGIRRGCVDQATAELEKSIEQPKRLRRWQCPTKNRSPQRQRRGNQIRLTNSSRRCELAVVFDVLRHITPVETSEGNNSI